MSSVRIGIAGMGNMGSAHARTLLAGKVGRGELVAVCDPDPARCAAVPGVRAFASAGAMIRAGAIDAVLIATPHYAHTTIGIAALRAGLHVLVEKPISVHKADAGRLLAAHRHPAQVFAAMFNQRTDPAWRTLHQLVHGGELGEIRRVNWINTDWFRSAAYYASGGWRATWAGEGGGVLLNQCPHNLDLFQWIFGMPRRVRAFCRFGRYHDIEVEDDVTAYLELANGATAVFIASTGEAPGTSRLEITAEGGRVIYERDRIEIRRNAMPMSVFSRETRESFARPDTMDTVVAASDRGGQHLEILQNFVAAILDGAPLIAPAAEGIHSVELANAMLWSAWRDETVDLPLNARRYARLLRQHIRQSRPKAATEAAPPADLSKSFSR